MSVIFEIICKLFLKFVRVVLFSGICICLGVRCVGYVNRDYGRLVSLVCKVRLRLFRVASMNGFLVFILLVSEFVAV